MSEEIPYTKRYIYNLDPAILESLHTLYFDSLTFEQRSYNEFIERRKDEVEESKTNSNDPNIFVEPVIVQPKARNIDSINTTLSNLRISKPQQNSGGNGNSGDNDNSNNTDNEGSDIESAESDSEAGSENDDQLSTVKEVEDNENYESTISFMSTKSPLVLFKSSILKNDANCFGIYKTCLNAKDSPNFDPLLVLKSITYNSTNPMPRDPIQAGMSAIFMLSSGHFAGAIISHLPHSTKGNKGSLTELQLQSVRFLAHKTFHRYTTRRKQGGSQSAMDDAKGKANSAGSTLRRYNEQALGTDIELLMEEWKPLIDQCNSIFIRGSGKGGKNARGIGLIVRDPKDSKAIIKTGDKRIKMIPFATKRPTTMELKRSWCELSYLKIVELPKVEKSINEIKRKRDELLNKSKESNLHNDKELEEKIKSTNELITLIKKSKAPALISFIKKNKNKIDVDFKLEPEDQYKNTPTLLHYASKKCYPFMVQTLIVQLHANPNIHNSIGKTAYEIAGDKETRFAFRLARNILGEDCNIDWDESRIGSGMSKQDIEDAKSKIKKEEEERENLERQELKESHESIVNEFRNKENSRQPKGNTITGPGVLRVTEEQKLSGLSEMQRMKVLREQRFRAIEARLKKQES
jgi:hypothetical protein